MADDAMAPPSALRIGSVLDGRYRLEALLGQGGIGQVFEASHLALGTSVAVKVLRPEYAATELLQRRFQREAKALTELSHPHIVAVTDVGVSDGTPYLVMEKVEGDPLSVVLRRGVLEPERALELTRQILRAVGHAHERGLVHRDLKPGNILVRDVDGRDHATVIDFGLARYTGERGRKGTKLTRRGSLIGTPAYMAPEQAAGGQADERADVYALGLITYEMLAGRRPFTERDSAKLLRAHLIEPVPPLESASHGLEVAADLEQWVQRALAKDRVDRFTNAQEMLAEFEALPPVRIGERLPARRWANPAERPLDAATPPDPTAETMPALEPASSVEAPALLSAPSMPETRDPGIMATRDSAVSAPAARTSRASIRLVGVAVVVVGGLFALVVGGGIMALVLSAGAGDEAPAASLASPEEGTDSPQVAPSDPSAPRGLDPEPAADELFGDLPRDLAGAHRRLAAGRRLDRSAIGRLNRYNRSHPRDARGRLLLGRHFTEVRSLSLALPEYRTALALDSDARRWPPLLPDLFEMVRSERLHSRAVRLIVSRYGAEALVPARAERARLRRPVERRRIDALIGRLESL